jgi:hypothetical protein
MIIILFMYPNNTNKYSFWAYFHNKLSLSLNSLMTEFQKLILKKFSVGINSWKSDNIKNRNIFIRK